MPLQWKLVKRPLLNLGKFGILFEFFDRSFTFLSGHERFVFEACMKILVCIPIEKILAGAVNFLLPMFAVFVQSGMSSLNCCKLNCQKERL